MPANFRHISISATRDVIHLKRRHAVALHYLRRKYDHVLQTYDAFAANELRDLVTSNCDLLILIE